MSFDFLHPGPKYSTRPASGFETKILIDRVDVRDVEQVNNWIKSAVKTFGRLDGAANVAGIAGGEGEFTADIVSLGSSFSTPI